MTWISGRGPPPLDNPPFPQLLLVILLRGVSEYCLKSEGPYSVRNNPQTSLCSLSLWTLLTHMVCGGLIYANCMTVPQRTHLTNVFWSMCLSSKDTWVYHSGQDIRTRFSWNVKPYRFSPAKGPILAPLNLWCVSTKLHRVTSQKTLVSVFLFILDLHKVEWSLRYT